MSTDQPTATATPRTDAQPLVKIYDRAGMPYDSELVSPDFARTLERELTEAKAEVWAFQRDLAEAKRIRGIELGRLRDLVVRTEKAEAALAEAKREATAQGEHAVAMTELAQSLQKELAIRCEEITALRKEDKSAVLADNAALRAEVTEFQAELRNAQTKLCDALTEADQLRAEVEKQTAIANHNIRTAADIDRVWGEQTKELRAQVAELQRLLGEVYRNTNLRHHPELTGLADIVSNQLKP